MLRRGGWALVALACVWALVVPARGALLDAATVYRDAFGVPHIVAPSQNALAYAMGFSLAEDRPFQLDLFRRAGAGRLSEILGSEYLEMDVEMRREFFVRDDLQRQLDAWDPTLRALWQSYANGINAGFAKVLANPITHPIEFIGSGYEPEPWTVLDSVAVSLLFTIADNGSAGSDGEIENALLLDRLKAKFGATEGEARWREALWMNDPDASTVIPEADAPPAPAGVVVDRTMIAPEQAALGAAAAPGLSATQAQESLFKKVVEELALPKLGSYAAAVSGTHAAGGRPLFLGAPQSGVALPPVMWEVGMHAPGIDCVGGAVPGAGPFLILGRCASHAWSIVAGNAGDNVDIVMERKSGDGYVANGDHAAFETRNERFLVRLTNPDPETPPQLDVHEATFKTSRNGVVYTESPEYAFVHKRAQAGHVVDNLSSLFHMTTARNYTEANTAAREGSWSVSIVYADADGHIAYWFTGLNPLRTASTDPRLPTPGESDAFGWSGFIPKDQNPHVVDPVQGFIVANQGWDSKPVAWWPASDDWRLGKVERRATTEERLRALIAGAPSGTIDLASIEALNKNACCDVDPLIGFLADIARRAVELHPSEQRQQAIAALDAWEATGFARVDEDGDGHLDDVGISLWAADDMPRDVYEGSLPPGPVWERLYHLVFDDDLPAFQYFGVQERATPLERVMRSAMGEPTGLPVAHDYFFDTNQNVAHTWDELVVRAIDESISLLGTPARVNEYPVRSFGVAELDPLRGFDHASYNFLVDFGSSSSGRSVLPPGQGVPMGAAAYDAYTNDGTLPPHMVDQLDLYNRFEFKPLRLYESEYLAPGVVVSSQTHVVPNATQNPPVAAADGATTQESVSVLVDVLSNDYDPDGDDLAVTRADGAQHGAVGVEGSQVRYTPRRGFHGHDSFVYTISDGHGGTDDATVSVTVDEVFIPRALSVTKIGAGQGLVTSEPSGIHCGDVCSGDFDEDSSVTLTATAAAGSSFAGWSGACRGPSASCVVVMDAAKTVTATFETTAAHPVHVSVTGPGDGRVTSSPGGIDCPSTCRAEFDDGTELRLTAVAQAGSSFSRWSGACAGQTGSTCTLTTPVTRTVGARFMRLPGSKKPRR